MIFHYRQRILTENGIPHLMINNTLIEQATEFKFLVESDKTTSIYNVSTRVLSKK